MDQIFNLKKDFSSFSQKFYFVLLFLSCLSISAMSEARQGRSVCTLKPEDQDAIYFTSDNYNISADGKTDISEALQGAINKLKLENNFGIIFIPEGIYRISRTIYIPASIRLIGYGKKRPLIFLPEGTPGYQDPVPSDKGKANYMFWFTSSVAEKGKAVSDAGAGTFYSALVNIDLKIEDGNPEAVALRTHYAQHSFIAHCDINTGNGKAGLFDIGNEMEDVRFFGGDYGIFTTKASPGWQFMMLDTYFEGQRIAAIKTQQAGLTIVRMTVRNVPEVIKVDSNYWEKLFMEDCLFENVTGRAISFDDEGNVNMQINLRNIICRKVPEPIRYRKTNTSSEGPSDLYSIENYIYGLQIGDLDSVPRIKTTFLTKILKKMPPAFASDIPLLPEMSS